MKYINRIITGFVAVGMLASCSLLDENPTTSLSETTVYSTPDALQAALNGCYRGYYDNMLFQGAMGEFLMDCSGIIHWKGSRTTQDWTDALMFTQTANHTYNLGQFTAMMKAVNYCNKLIDAIPSSPVEDSFKKEVEGEAKLLRGIMYFHMVRLWGDVTLYTSSPKNINETSGPRAPYCKVYEQIIADLTDAENMMRDAARQKAVTGDLGRPNKWAATAFKASVYLTIGSLLDSPDDNFWDSSKDAALIAAGKPARTPDFSALGINSAADAWNKAIDCAENVIDNGPYKLAAKYTDLFRWTDPEDFQLPERIFVLNASPKMSAGTYTAFRSLPLCPEGTSEVDPNANSNYARWHPDRWIYQKWCEFYGGEMGGATSNARNIYVSCNDPRLDATMYHGSYHNLAFNADAKVYPNSSAIFTGSYGSKTAAGTYSFPMFKKYADPRYKSDAGYADFYMLRFAEMYLIAAEAYASISSAPGDANWNKALDYMEVIHKRARETVTPAAAEPTFANKTFADKNELVNAIMFDRFYEMMGEGHEYYDTHRRGAKWLADNIAVPKNEFLLLPEQGTTNPFTGTAASNGGYTKYHYTKEGFQYPTDVQKLRQSLLLAYPEQEFIYNSSIDITVDQNDFHW